MAICRGRQGLCGLPLMITDRVAVLSDLQGMGWAPSLSSRFWGAVTISGFAPL
jgi:hypothetical protein